MELTQLLAEGGWLSDALRLFHRLEYSGNPDLGMAAGHGLMSAGPALSPRDRLEIAETLRHWAEADLSLADKSNAARLTYNASQYCQSHPDRQLELLDEAAELDSVYRQRDYWWRERGAALFRSGDYAGAATAYGRALRMGDQSALPLLADAKMFLGEYQEAQRLLATLSSDPDTE